MRPLRLLPKYLAVSLALMGAAVLIIGIALLPSYRGSLDEIVSASASAGSDAAWAATRRQAESSAAILASALAEAVYHGRGGDTSRLLNMARDLPGSRDAQFRVADPARETAPPDVPRASRSWIEEGLLQVEAPVWHGDRYVGMLYLELEPDAFLEPVAQLQDALTEARADLERRSLLRGLAGSLLAMLLVLAIVAWLVSRLVRALTEIGRHAEQLGRGAAVAPLARASNDELGDLADDFNRLSETLRETTISKDYLDTILQSMSDAILLFEERGQITRVNDAATRLLGFAGFELLGRDIRTLIAEDERGRFDPGETTARPRETLLVSRDGRRIPISFTNSRIGRDAPGQHGFIMCARDVTERKISEQRIRYLARIDALTKIPNRMQFQHLLQRAIGRARRTKQSVALLYMDVDRFKDINDTFGHSTGDACLETLASRVTTLLPPGGFAGRLAGDEFGIVIDCPLPDSQPHGEIARFAHRVLQALAEPVQNQAHEIIMTASIGIAFYPAQAGSVIDLIRNADAALYEVKRRGGNGHEFYDASMNAESVERLMLKSKLRQSYENDELLINYQPKIELATGMIVGAEALVRWDMTDHGLVLPSEFIPLAEETNLILEIGEWVLNRVCADYRDWQRELAVPGRISVNLSLKQLSQPNFIKRIQRILRRHGVDPGSLELEVTETTLMQDVDRTIRLLTELHDMGLHLAIDDFGTGYSSLSALQQFPISTLKIDKSFVRNAASDSDDATIVSTIADMGCGMNLKVVAEGVETHEQLDFLRTIKCDYAQGILFGKPMPASEFLALMVAQHQGSGTYRALLG